LHFARKGGDLDRVDDYIPWLRAQLGHDTDYFDHGVNCNSLVARPWDKPERLHPTNFIVTQAVDFLRRRDPTRPFFLYLSFHRPHPPYDPPRWAFEKYVSRKMPPPPCGDWVDLWADYADPARPDCWVGEVREDVLHAARAGYYGHMTHIDHQINRFVETLAEYGLANDTWFCFTSDHGEMLGDHRLFRKAWPYEGSARVPLILKGPPAGQVRPGTVCDVVAELRDVLPTLLDCAGLPVPSSVEGKSLLPLARGEDVKWRGHLHGEHTLFGQSLQWLTDGCEKYIWCSGTGQEQLFDLVVDPQEERDLAAVAESKARVERWRKLLIGDLTGREEGFTDGEKLIPGRPVGPCLRTVFAP
jgi:arylsulfatase A-like enzyme